MKKLSELSRDTILTVENRNHGGFSVMDVAEYINSEYYLECHKTTIAEEIYPKTTIEDIAEMLACNYEDEMHEDWGDRIQEAITYSKKDFEPFVKNLNRIFEKNPTYYEGEPVEIDILTE